MRRTASTRWSSARARGVELGDEVGCEAPLALARFPETLDAGLHHVEGRVDPGLGRDQPVDEVGPEAVRAVGIGEDAVDDHVDAGIEAVLHGVGGRAVRGREPAVAVRLVRHRHQLGHGVRRSVGIGGPGRSAARDDLDVVGAFLEQLAHLGAHRLLAVGLRAEVAHVPARHGDGPAADHHAGPGSELAADALAQGEGHAPLRAVLPQRGDAGVQQGARVPGGLQEQDVVVLFRDVIAEGAVTRGDEVRVGVDESGQNGGGAVVPPLHGRAVGRPDLALAADRGDAVTVDQERGVVDGHGRAAVEQTVGRDQGEARRRRRYRGLTACS